MPSFDSLGEFCRVAGQHQLDALHTLLDSAGIVAAAEARQDRAIDDDLRHCVGEDRLKPTADLDADLTLI